MNIAHAVGYGLAIIYNTMRLFFTQVIMPFIFVVGVASIVWFSITAVNYSDTKNKQRQDFKECVDLTHSAVWCYEKIR